jgi:hypothetical protein
VALAGALTVSRSSVDVAAPQASGAVIAVFSAEGALRDEAPAVTTGEVQAIAAVAL